MEVFMVVRHHAIDFASGALVFPGGRVEGSDGVLARDTSMTPALDGVTPEAMEFRIAAIRETFEECGVLYARKRGADELIGGDLLREIEAAHRTALCEGEIDFRAMLAKYDLLPGVEWLTDFAHWITPKHQPKRYDTRFFLAGAPAEHLAVHDGTESVDSLWIAPRQVLKDTADGRFKLVFATQMNLMKLANFKTTEEAIAAAREDKIVTVCPEMVRIDGKRRLLRIPIEAGYGAAEFMVENPPAS
jgi:8-oxo-dGTP pyrophosphatase MutT (NUDIX family)